MIKVNLLLQLNHSLTLNYLIKSYVIKFWGMNINCVWNWRITYEFINFSIVLIKDQVNEARWNRTA